MISLILYGRNDSYGYNLHKRAAISLNCMAEVLTAADDEIIFVDYNTPDDFPTFPEAIQDTLTERAKKLLRILRVRPSQHEPFRLRTGLVALEPIARNVALRRSNPSNRWVLSTNTDMVFVPQRGRSLSEVAAELSDAYYPLPRFEVPETLWESADRLNPQGTIEAFGAWGRAFHLNEIVLSADPTVKYDAPGDFQLALRSDLWQIHGFHEGMLLGWHVDSNLAKRLSLLPRRQGDVVDEVFGYHCDHTRQVTPAHRPRAAENDMQAFVVDITSAELPEQAETWGLAGQDVEEVRVNATSRLYLEALNTAVPTPLDGAIPQLAYEYSNYNHIDYSPDHVLPFVADALASYPRHTLLGWFGSKRKLLDRFAVAWRTMGFSQDVLVWSGADWLGETLPDGCVTASIESMMAVCHVFLFDWGRRDSVPEADWDFASDEASRGVSRALRHAVRQEREQVSAALVPPRRFIGINAVCNDAEALFHDLVGAARTPLATRIRQGYVNDLRRHQDMMHALNLGAAGRRVGGEIVSQPGIAGYLFYVHHLLLDSGNYRFHLDFESSNEAGPLVEYGGFDFEVRSNACLLYDRLISAAELRTGSLDIDFVIPRGFDAADDWPETELRMRTIGHSDISVGGAILEKVDSPEKAADSDEGVAVEFNFLPLLTAGPAGTFGPEPAPIVQLAQKLESVAINSKPGVSDFLAFGPHVWLLPGRYEATYEFWSPAVAEQRGIEARIEVVTGFGKDILAEEFVDFSARGLSRRGRWQSLRGVLAFDIRSKAPLEGHGLLEFRVWSTGAEHSFTRLDVRRVGDAGPEENRIEPIFDRKLDSTREAVARRVRLAYDEHLPPQDVLWLLQAGPAGKRAGHLIEALPGILGVVAHGPYLWLLPGYYEVMFELTVDLVEVSSGNIRIEIVREQGNQVLASRIVGAGRRGFIERLMGRRSEKQHCALTLDITTDMPPVDSGLLEFRIWSPGTITFAVTAVRVRQVETSGIAAQESAAPLFGGRVDPVREAVTLQVERAYRDHLPAVDILGLMQVGHAGCRVSHAIHALPGMVDIIAHGPYIGLLPGHYEVAFEIFAQRARSGTYIQLEVVADTGSKILASGIVDPHWHGRRFEHLIGPRRGKLRYVLPFEITADASSAESGTLEFRVFSPGSITFKLTSVLLRRVDAAYADAEETVLRSP